MSLSGTQVHLVENLDDALAFKRWLGERHENNAIGVDTETTGLDPREPKAGIRLIQFGDTMTGWSVPWEDWRGLAMEALTQWDGTWALWNCFAGDTQFITRDGMRTLQEAVGETVEVWDGTEWSKAEIRSFGSRPLQRVVFAPRGRRTAYREIICATPDHRWELIDGSTTTRLSVGDVVPMSAPTAEMDEVAFKHGLIYADGTLFNKGKKNAKGQYCHQLRMCGAKAKHAALFEHVISPPSYSGDPMAYVKSETNYKELPDNLSAEYVRGFIAGWADYDGTYNSTQRSRQLSTTRRQDVDWLIANAGLGGFIVTGVTSSALDTAFSAAGTDTCWYVTLWSPDKSAGETPTHQGASTSRRFNAWRVESIETLEGTHPVYCAVVPGRARFTLRNGIFTSNCAFEQKWLVEHAPGGYRLPRDRSVDGMIAAHIINPLGPGGLKQNAAKFVDRRAVAGQNALSEGMSDNGWTWRTVPINYQPYWCVPLDTEILTRSGWKRWSDVSTDDETMGYDGGDLRWTSITNIHRFADAPLVRVGNTRWSTECTPDHRWLYQVRGASNRLSDVRIAPLSEISTDRRARLVLSGYGVGGDADITEDEARVVAWLMTDDGIQWQRERTSPIAHIYQSEDKYCDDIRALLHRTGMYVSEKVASVNETTGNANVRFYVQATAVTKLWDKARLHDVSPLEFVLSLSRPARQAWLEVVVLADGQTRGAQRPTDLSPRTEVTKRRGPVHDAIVLAALLEDNMVSVRQHGDNSAVIGFGSQKRPTFQKNKPVPVGTGEVWCPTTELGTWVARDRDGRVFVTGNCYAALDSILTARLWGIFKEQVGPGGPYAQVFDLEMAVRFIVSRMEEHGARVDVGYAQQQMLRLEHDADAVEAWAKQVFGINIASNDQLGRKLVELGGVLLDKTATGKDKVDKYTLQVLMDPENGYPDAVRMLAEQALRARQARKFASTYFRNFVDKSYDGLIHADIRTLGARTGRMSVGSPALQQLPKNNALVRNAFVPSEGNVLVTCDMDQIEGRIFASMSNDVGLTEAFHVADTTGGDFFVEIAKQVYREPHFQKSDKRRTLVKSMVYGRLYGAGIAKMAETAGVPVARMQMIAEAMDAAYPGMAAFMKQIESDGWERQKKEGQGYIVTPLGRRLPADENRLYALVNYGIQSAAADVLKQSLVRLDAAGYDEFMILPVHDEVLVDIPEAYADQALRDIPLLMQDLSYSVPLTAGADGPWARWGDRY